MNSFIFFTIPSLNVTYFSSQNVIGKETKFFTFQKQRLDVNVLDLLYIGK